MTTLNTDLDLTNARRSVSVNAAAWTMDVLDIQTDVIHVDAAPTVDLPNVYDAAGLLFAIISHCDSIHTLTVDADTTDIYIDGAAATANTVAIETTYYRIFYSDGVNWYCSAAIQE